MLETFLITVAPVYMFESGFLIVMRCEEGTRCERNGEVAMKKGSKWIVVLLAMALLVGTAGMAFTNQLQTQRDRQDAQSETSLVESLGDNSSQAGETSSAAETGAVNPLTGMPVEKGRQDSRPVAVMINNLKKAQPLMGVQQADLLYECLVEGGITRLMAVYQDYQSAPVVGSVRSARPYYIHLASSLDAVYVHVGGSNQARDLLRQNLVDDFDFVYMEQYMWRDADRRAQLGFEHSALTSGQRLTEAIDDKEIRTSRKEEAQSLEFSQISPVLQGENTAGMSVNFSSYKTTEFTYDEEKRGYLVSQFDKPMIDGNLNEQVVKQNVLLLRINTYPIDDYGLMAMDLAGSGEGVYLGGGKRIDIRWSRKTEDSPFVFTTKDGQPLTLLPGQSYLCCVPLQTRVTFS
ncbi:MAG: DUF3048 domain-containing protein [Clostridiales bacterium]|nr:DUF3048 domain-containing protein [Clostridiales bacterium]